MSTVAVVGYGVLVPGAATPEELWDLLRDGRPVFGEPRDRFSPDDFWSADPTAEDRTYTRLAGYLHDTPPHPDARNLTAGGDCARWLRHCLLSATRDLRIADDTRVACYNGQWVDGSQDLEENLLAAVVLDGLRTAHGTAWDTALEHRVRRVLRRHLPRLTDDPRTLLPDAVLRAALDGLFPHVVDQLVVDTACSSSLYTIDLGARAVASGECDLALCGGVHQVTPKYSVLFSKVRGLSASGDVRSLDEHADGTLFTDGAAVVALKTLRRAHADGDPVLGVLSGFGASCDGAGKAVHAPNPGGQRLAVTRARRSSGDVDWVVAHGTGTPVGDAVELGVLRELGGTHLVTANKSLLGHTGWAAGAVSVIHVLEALRHGTVPAQHRFGRLPDPHADAVRVPASDVPWPGGGRRRLAGVSAFGFGGTNAHLHLADLPGAPAAGDIPGTPAPAGAPGAPAPARSSTDHDMVLVALTTAHDTTPPPADAVTARAVRLVPPTLREIDPSQIQALLLTRQFIAEHGRIWAGLEDRTGVISGFREPLPRSADVTVRVYRDVLARVAGDLRTEVSGTAAEALAATVAEVHGRAAPVGADTLAGTMPNVTPSRIAVRENLRGLSMAVCGGPDPLPAALRTAHRYLRDGDLDLALVLTVHSGTIPWTAGPTDPPTTGTCLMALTTREIARTHGWPVTTHLTPETTAAPTPTPRTARHVVHHTPQPPSPVREPIPVLPPGALVLTDSLEVARTLAARIPPGGVVVCTEPGTAPGVVHVAQVHDDTVDRLTDQVLCHVRTVSLPPDSTRPARRTVRLQELAFLAARRLWRGEARGSFLTLLPDAFAGAVPKPRTALFTGMARSLALDLPGCRTVTLLTDLRDPVAGLGLLEEETRCADTVQGVHHRAGVRYVAHVQEAPRPPARGLVIGDGSVVVATGGARGITGACLEALAEVARPTLWLLGRSVPDDRPRPLPARPDFLRTWLREHPGELPLAANHSYERLLHRAETTRTLHRLRTALGPDRVHHLTCDVTDADQVRTAADRVLSAHPAVTLLIHGAGINNSAAPGHKTLADFRAVSAPKTAGYHHLRDAFDGHVEHWCNFGSISGTLGQPGEADYAAANDYLAAWSLHRQTSGIDEFTYAWTLWRDVGMGSGKLRQALGARRSQLSGITPAEGRALFLAELATGRTGDPVVLNLGEAERRTMSERLPGVVREL
ncbi:beta-ketoacyl synthase N-terminal-like domain-containing protein [Streptomyces sp. NPDC004539]|uniref:beta-ketoacyl synthase N-terminal-like domain-containing protein n=1 Tax=Streptomyces sp. NPDC004539 TaxID=3154280 RepID=UPI0033B6CF73